MFVAATCANAAIWWYRGRRAMAKNPTLKPGYRRLIRGFLIFRNIPYLVLGSGLELWGYAYPKEKLWSFLFPFAMLVPVYWLATGYWLIFRGGAEDLVAHPGLPRGTPQNPNTIKVGYAVLILVLVLGFAGIFSELSRTGQLKDLWSL